MLRVPVFSEELKVVVLGDWGEISQVGEDKGYVDIMPCLSQKI